MRTILPFTSRRALLSKFQIRLIEDLDLRIVRVLEEATHEEAADFFESEFLQALTKNLIWEFMPGALQLMSTDDLRR